MSDYIVLKRSDLHKYLSDEVQMQLYSLISLVEICRYSHGEKPLNVDVKELCDESNVG